MGEAKRRQKLLGDEYGKHNGMEIKDTENGSTIRFRFLKYSGEIKIFDSGLLISWDDEYTDEENEFIGCLYSMLLPAMLDFYGYEKINIEFRFVADFSKTKTSKTAMIDFYPAIWDELPEQARDRRRAQLQLKDFENIAKSISHKSPAEHTRKAHKRRVRYGKGRKYTKWVEIDETVINEGKK